MNTELMSQVLTSNQENALRSALNAVEHATALPGGSNGELLSRQCASMEWEQLIAHVQRALTGKNSQVTENLENTHKALKSLAPGDQLKLFHGHEIRKWLTTQLVLKDEVSCDTLAQELIAQTWHALAQQDSSEAPSLTTRLSIAPDGTLALPGIHAHLRGRLPGSGSSVPLRIDSKGVTLLDGRVSIPSTTLRDWWKITPTGTIHVGKGIDLVFNPCLNGTGIRLHSDADLTTNRTRQENLLAEAADLLRGVWPDIYGAFLALTDAIEFLDDPLQSVVSDRLAPGRMQWGTFAHDSLVAATELSHEIAHLYLYEKTRLGQIDDTAETQVFSPWKQTERPIYLTLHALTTYLSQSVFLARYTLDQGTMLPYITATLGQEIERLQIGARAFAEAVGSDMNSQTRDIIGAVEAFTDYAKAAC